MADLSDNTNWFETDASNNKASPNGWPEGMMPSGVNDTARGDKGALKRFWDRINPVQLIFPSAGLWTFATSNTAYPAAYVQGEIYTFKAASVSIGGDQFQINTLGPKPIVKATASGWVPIVAGDIEGALAPQLIFDQGVNGGTGGFVLLNPYVPVFGNGAGGIVLSGDATVDNLHATGAAQVDGSATFNGGVIVHNGATVDNLHATGASQVDGSATFNGGVIVHGGATVDTFNGGVIVHGDATVDNLHATGASQVDGSATFNGGVIVHGGATVDNLHATGASQVDGSATFNAGMTVTASGTAINVPNGNISTGHDVIALNDISAQGVFRRSPLGGGNKGARVECYGGSWGDMAFALSSGNLVISSDGGISGFNFMPSGSFSDARLKIGIRDTAVDALAAICATPVRAYEWNERGQELMPDAGPVACGLVAQDLEQTIPFAVGSVPIAGDMRHINDPYLTPYLFRAIQQLEARVTELESRLARE